MSKNSAQGSKNSRHRKRPHGLPQELHPEHHEPRLERPGKRRNGPAAYSAIPDVSSASASGSTPHRHRPSDRRPRREELGGEADTRGFPVNQDDDDNNLEYTWPPLQGALAANASDDVASPDAGALDTNVLTAPEHAGHITAVAPRYQDNTTGSWPPPCSEEDWQHTTPAMQRLAPLGTGKARGEFEETEEDSYSVAANHGSASRCVNNVPCTCVLVRVTDRDQARGRTHGPWAVPTMRHPKVSFRPCMASSSIARESQ